MIRLAFLTFFILAFSIGTFAQVKQIKEASSAVSRGGDGGSAGGEGILVDLLFNVVFGEVIHAQREKLQRRDEVPGMVSLEARIQTAIQPSNYYIIHPRLRANWGLFSTDFRVNYLLEEAIGETLYLRTNDWQVVQLNIVTTRDVVFRMGGGFIHESFNDGNVYGEWSSALELHPQRWNLGCNVEYRDADVRKEISGNVQYPLFDEKVFHAYATAGALYQKYYSSVPVWGLQCGIVVNIY